MRLMLAAAAILAASVACGQTLRLPCRMILTTTTRSRLTGMELDSESKSKLTPVAVDIRKVTDDGESVIVMQTRPAKLEDEDGASRLQIPAGDLADILAALDKGRAALSRPRASGDASETLHNANGLTMTLLTGRRSCLQMEWDDGRKFELASSHIQQLAATLKRL